jgi:hypothetical protein
MTAQVILQSKLVSVGFLEFRVSLQRKADILSPFVKCVFGARAGFGYRDSHFPNCSVVQFAFHLAKYFQREFVEGGFDGHRYIVRLFRIDEVSASYPGLGITSSLLETLDVSIGLLDLVLQGREIGFYSQDCLVGTR